MPRAIDCARFPLTPMASRRSSGVAVCSVCTVGSSTMPSSAVGSTTTPPGLTGSRFCATFAPREEPCSNAFWTLSSGPVSPALRIAGRFFPSFFHKEFVVNAWRPSVTACAVTYSFPICLENSSTGRPSASCFSESVTLSGADRTSGMSATSLSDTAACPRAPSAAAFPCCLKMCCTESPGRIAV